VAQRADGPRVVLCATNDLAQDQRLHKMACTLADAGYSPWLVGRLRPHSQPMAARRYFFTRMRLRFGRGKLFYLEYNLRLFWRLLRMRIDILTANDLDTLPACFAIALLRRIPLVYDSHEYFSGSAELAQRPLERAIWRGLEQLLLPLLPTRLTVSQQVVDAYRADGYGFALVRNLPYALPAPSPPPAAASRILLYQGMLNAGRGLPWLVEALPLLPGWQAWIVGDGVMRAPLEAQARQLGVAHRIRWWGMQPFQQLPHITAQASIGLSIEDNESLNNRYSAPNKLYDYLQARLPVVVTPQPEHSALVQQYGLGVVMQGFSGRALAYAVQQLVPHYAQYQQQAELAARQLHWHRQAPQVLELYQAARPL